MRRPRGVHGYRKNGEQVRNKLNKMVKKYENLKNDQNTSGESSKVWVHFEQLDRVFGCRDNINPEYVVDGHDVEKRRNEEDCQKSSKKRRKNEDQ